MQPTWLPLSKYRSTKMDNDTFLMASIFHKAYPLSPEPSAAEFLQHFEFEIDKTCHLLEFLGLAEKAPSTLGFKPTHRMIGIVIDRKTKNPFAKVDRDFFDLLWE